jgi:hypothetical protein
MRECRTYGSVWGAPGNGRSYRDQRLVLRGDGDDGYDDTGRWPGGAHRTRWRRRASRIAAPADVDEAQVGPGGAPVALTI